MNTERNVLESKMKFLLLPHLFLQAAKAPYAHTSECATIPKSGDRLACYDRARPPSSAKPVAAKQKEAAASSTPPDQGLFVDVLAVENAKLDAKLKKICRGC
jgi:hypothetical protein